MKLHPVIIMLIKSGSGNNKRAYKFININM